MKNKKKVEKLIKEQKLKKEKKTNKILFSIFIAFIFASIVFNSVYYFWCDIKCYYQETFLWDKEVPRNYVCMNGDKHKPHETKAISINNNVFYVCSSKCAVEIKYHFSELAYSKDALTGKIIFKSNAFIGFKSKNQPDVVYFENKQNFKNYYSNLKNN
ncbi:hypothetical protein SDC9_38033 [bioreactor metagenome]|jgi:hypothetical protein|uniref:TRASH domain-containing protein n=1 Tax=bioreactor metagenome TaxID=1076179 RepID=A0A644VKW0_9ZZZZ|nr:hypothetical protein [Paludibacter sp.]